MGGCCLLFSFQIEIRFGDHPSEPASTAKELVGTGSPVPQAVGSCREVGFAVGAAAAGAFAGTAFGQACVGQRAVAPS